MGDAPANVRIGGGMRWLALAVPVCVAVMLAAWTGHEVNGRAMARDADDVWWEVTSDGALDGSVWCSPSDTHAGRMCRFRNLCRDTRRHDFFVVRGETSVFEGAPLSGDEPLLDLGTVHGADLYPLRVRIEPASRLSGHRVLRVMPTTLLMARNLPDNLMHVLHDDVIPAVATLARHGVASAQGDAALPFDALLQFVDDRPVDVPHADLYANLVNRPLRHLGDLSTAAAADVVCFRAALAGLSRASTWYQYGYGQPQGAIAGKAASAAPAMADYVRRQSAQWSLPIARGAPPTEGHIVLIERRDTRRLLNADALAAALSAALRRAVHRVSLETHSVRAICALARNATLLVGAHGAALSLAAFLPRGGALVEVFPYAVRAEAYAPYRSLAALAGVGYRAVETTDAAATVTHADWPPRLGGIAHFDEAERARIVAAVPVPPHACCSDPIWLFRAYQDTKVDVRAVVRAARAAIEDGQSERANAI